MKVKNFTEKNNLQIVLLKKREDDIILYSYKK
jgi:hypothetical protein